jgi:hypothetical protein
MIHNCVKADLMKIWNEIPELLCLMPMEVWWMVSDINRNAYIKTRTQLQERLMFPKLYEAVLQDEEGFVVYIYEISRDHQTFRYIPHFWHIRYNRKRVIHKWEIVMNGEELHSIISTFIHRGSEYLYYEDADPRNSSAGVVNWLSWGLD